MAEALAAAAGGGGVTVELTEADVQAIERLQVGGAASPFCAFQCTLTCHGHAAAGSGGPSSGCR